MKITMIKKLLENNTFKIEIVKSYSDFVSISNKSIPTAGSQTAPLDNLVESELLKNLTSIVNHKQGFTVKTNIVNLRFWKN